MKIPKEKGEFHGDMERHGVTPSYQHTDQVFSSHQHDGYGGPFFLPGGYAVCI
jgi:hypothetical protein